MEEPLKMFKSIEELKDYADTLPPNNVARFFIADAIFRYENSPMAGFEKYYKEKGLNN